MGHNDPHGSDSLYVVASDTAIARSDVCDTTPLTSAQVCQDKCFLFLNSVGLAV